MSANDLRTTRSHKPENQLDDTASWVVDVNLLIAVIFQTINQRVDEE